MRNYLILVASMFLCVFHVKAQQSRNYVKTYVAREEVSGTLSGVKNKQKVQESFQYIDGLGRLHQTVARWGSPLGKDVITPIVYDQYGRQVKQYLPYVDTSPLSSLIDSEHFRPEAIAQQNAFFDTFYGGTSGDYAVAGSVLEASPLSRVVKQGATGEAWQIEGTHTVDFVYRQNDPDEVKALSIAADVIEIDASYDAGELMVKETRDENNGDQEGETLEYANKRGQIILKSVKDSNSSHLLTYYLYDEYERLRYVVPPAAMAEIMSTATPDWNLLKNESFQRKWMFCYEYDERNRMIAKRVPGAGWTYMVYDQRDRLVLTQHGNLRQGTVDQVDGDLTVSSYDGKSYQLNPGASVTLSEGFKVNTNFVISADDIAGTGKWIFTKYDELNRPVATGFYASNLSRADLQQQVNVTPIVAEQIVSNGSMEGYSNASFPANVPSGQLLTISYYDRYRINLSSIPTGVQTSPKGQLTGGKTRILGTNQWLRSETFYDQRYRVVKIISDNHKGGQDIVEMEYRNAISPLVQFTKMSHTSSDFPGTLVMEETQAYDHMDRPTATHLVIKENDVQQFNGTLVKNEYNEIGELASKALNTDAQKLDYAYNMRGWLTKINDVSSLGSSDKFGMVLKYDNAGTHSQYNGNIGTMSWKSIGATGNNNLQTFHYSYDPMSRLESADYKSTGKNDRFDVGNISYDANGNILSLDRYHEVVGARKQIDRLAYTYSEGNQLSKVTDNGDAAAVAHPDPQINLIKELGFRDGNTSGEDYSYDINGNMVSDANKAIASIEYNHLNLPARITFENGGYVRYLYDAIGTRLQKEVNLESGNPQLTDYIDGKHYKNGVLEFFRHSEGRVLKNGNQYDLEFHLTDHLGNVRVTIDEQGNTTQRDDYYPFGATFNNYKSGQENLYKFNGLEEQKETDNYMAFYRDYDFWLGRWNQIDPKANEFFSPYAGMQNNPVFYADPLGDTVKFAGKAEETAYNDYKNEVNSRVQQYDKRTQKLRAKGKTEKADERDANRANNVYVQIQGELSKAEADKTIFRVRSGSNSSNPAGGGNVSYNPKTKEIDVNINTAGDFSTMQRIAHEFKHVDQFINKELDFHRNGIVGGILYDKTDEIAAFRRQNHFGTVRVNPISIVNRDYAKLPAQSRSFQSPFFQSMSAAQQHQYKTGGYFIYHGKK